jgi:hypothetical protein
MVFSRPIPILPRWDIGGRDAMHVTTIKQAATFVQYGWSIHKAAKSFGIKKGTLHSYCKKYGIQSKHVFKKKQCEETPPPLHFLAEGLQPAEEHRRFGP